MRRKEEKGKLSVERKGVKEGMRKMNVKNVKKQNKCIHLKK